MHTQCLLTSELLGVKSLPQILPKMLRHVINTYKSYFKYKISPYKFASSPQYCYPRINTVHTWQLCNRRKGIKYMCEIWLDLWKRILCTHPDLQLWNSITYNYVNKLFKWIILSYIYNGRRVLLPHFKAVG